MFNPKLKLTFYGIEYSERLQDMARIWKNGQNGRHGAGRPFLPFWAIFWSRSEYMLRIYSTERNPLLLTLKISLASWSHGAWSFPDLS